MRQVENDQPESILGRTFQRGGMIGEDTVCRERTIPEFESFYTREGPSWCIKIGSSLRMQEIGWYSGDGGFMATGNH